MIRTSTLIAAALTLAFSTPATAQISYGGRPNMLKAEKLGIAKTSAIQMPAVDVPALMTEDEAKLTSGVKGPYRFGFNHAVDLSLDNSGSWYTYPNGDRFWHVTVQSKGAISINMEFHDYLIPEGAQVFVLNETGEYLGAYTAESNGGRPTMGVSPIAGDKVTIEYFEPAAKTGEGRLQIGQITHAYRDPFGFAKGLGDSGSCNNNVICPEGDNWRDQIASVAMIVVGGSGACTGSLINNCNNDGTPYFLTANHCLGGSVSNWVFRFNWESPTCANTTNGPTNQTVSGSTLLASSAGSDVGLLELNTAPPSNYNVFYSGWDKSGTAPTSSTAIHHPSGDIKKISFDDDAATQAPFGGAQCWRIANWEDGTTEPGSSGSGLWNQNGLLIGQLYGGQASCSNNVNDYYGRIDVSWPTLSPHLGNCGNTLAGYDPNGSAFDYDALPQSISGFDAVLCNVSSITPVVTIKNNGVQTLTTLTIGWNLDNGATSTMNWSGSLATGQTADVTLPSISFGGGAHTLNVSTSLPNGQADQNTGNDTKSSSFTANSPGQLITLNITLDDYGSETTWILEDQDGNTLYSGGPYTDGQDQTVVSTEMCLSNNCFVLTIFDDYGDGICCGYGNGSYEVVDQFGMSYVTGNGVFTDDVTENFCLTNTGTSDLTNELGVALAPNPNTGQFELLLPQTVSGTLQIDVLDAMGRLVHNEQVQQPTQRMGMDLQHLAKGNYMVRVRSNEGVSTLRMAIER